MLRTASTQLTDEVKRLTRLAAAIGRPDKYAGKRKSPRFRAELWMDFSLDPAESTVVQVTANDVSPQGISFWMRKQLEPGTRVFLRDASDEKPHPWIPLLVTHCVAGLKGFLIGGEFEKI